LEQNETEYKLLFMTIYENIKQLESVGQLHSNTLVNADCLEAMKYIADKSIDMVLCDLPYEPRSWNIFNADFKLPSNVLNFPAVVSNSLGTTVAHPTQKPVASIRISY
jgi:hypothetical protein